MGREAWAEGTVGRGPWGEGAMGRVSNRIEGAQQPFVWLRAKRAELSRTGLCGAKRSRARSKQLVINNLKPQVKFWEEFWL